MEAVPAPSNSWEKSYTEGVHLCSALSACRDQMSLGPGCDSLANPLSQGPFPTHRRCPRRGCGTRVLGSQIHERRCEVDRSGERTQLQLGPFYLTRFLTETPWDGAGYSGHRKTVRMTFVGV